MIKLSIITINYNNKAGLEKTIQSVIGQEELDFEYIIIDGGSNDGSKELIESYQNKINYWVSEKDEGIYYAQNKGIIKAKGEYCLFLNSGDFLCDSKVLKDTLSFRLDKDIVYGNMKINWGNNSITDGILPDKIELQHMVKDTIWHPVSFIRRAIFDMYGMYDVSYSMVADYDFFFRVIIAKHCSTKHIPVFVAEYNTDGLSSDPNKKNIESEERKRVISSYLGPEEAKRVLNQIHLNVNPFKRLVHYLINRFK